MASVIPTSAPDRISIKRRRVDEPVDHLLYQSKKQRTSNHIFVRIQPGKEEKELLRSGSTPFSVPTEHRATDGIPGIPAIRTTQPGDEIKDFQKYKADQDARKQSQATEKIVAQLLSSKEVLQLASASSHTRKFHLTRDLSTTLRPQAAGGIRKTKSFVRPHLPTFIERYEAASKKDLSIYVKTPIDRIIKSARSGDKDLEPQQIIDNASNIQKSNVKTFQKPLNNVAKNGRSMHDDPATWDLNSDQLADELIQLALEMDPDAKSAYLTDQQKLRDGVLSGAQAGHVRADENDDYIFETYIRVQQHALMDLDLTSKSTTLGYLVIDDEEEELWEQYLREDEDDDNDWDEEDADSNAEDNPRNDYPDDELSSDDEYGVDIYKYRRDYSDDEQFDESNQ